MGTEIEAGVGSSEVMSDVKGTIKLEGYLLLENLGEDDESEIGSMMESQVGEVSGNFEISPMGESLGQVLEHS